MTYVLLGALGLTMISLWILWHRVKVLEDQVIRLSQEGGQADQEITLLLDQVTTLVGQLQELRRRVTCLEGETPSELHLQDPR